MKSVSVKVGDEVAAGDTLAQLDTTSLETQLHSAQQTLAQAELTLENGLNGQKATTSPSGGGGSGAVRSASVRSDGSTTRIVFTAAQSDPELEAAQKAVLDAEQAVDAALTTASTAYDTAVTVCTAQNADADACQTALAASLDAQKDVQTAQNQLVEASVAYDDLLAKRAADSGGGSTPGGGSAPGGGSTPGGGTGGSAPDTRPGRHRPPAGRHRRADRASPAAPPAALRPRPTSSRTRRPSMPRPPTSRWPNKRLRRQRSRVPSREPWSR